METTTNAIGRRKAAVARVYLQRGNGKITINERKMDDYLPMSTLRSFVEEPFRILEIDKTYDVTINVAGGGIKGQTEAIRLGVARALVKINPEFKPRLKAKGILTLDPRVVERKKPGKKKARKSEQFSKR